MRALIDNIALMGTIHVVEAKQTKINVLQYGVFLLKVKVSMG